MKFKKIIAMCMTAIMSLSVMSVTALADNTANIVSSQPNNEITPRSHQWIVTATALNVRSAPGLDSPIVGVLYYGDVVWATDSVQKDGYT